ncbi:MAG: glycine zipper 2TM domain-containing protein [Ottowia sp.]|uniref:glycine zipper 2TM domain-containing protein n=1 Tax=Ottowia sp. TaxID=1898956 RepID=UPI0039E2F13D
MQTTQRLLSSVAAIGAAAMLAACAAPGYYQQGGHQYPANPGAYPSSPGYANMGRVTNVEYLRGNQASGVAGAVVGGAVGGLAGNQIGRGGGRAAATIAGVVGGALIGRSIEQNTNRGGMDIYRVTVQFDNGGMRSFDYAQPPNVQIGDRVRAEGDQLYR